MIKRCIMIFPSFENGKLIDEIRTKYDPVAHNVRPHITLVFPFESDITTEELRSHMMAALSGFTSFRLSLQGVIEKKTFGKYLLLEVHRGRQRIIALHKSLYTGILSPFLPVWQKSFEPHMTVGRVEDEVMFQSASDETRHFCEEFATVADKISVEIIADNNDSIIEFEIGLPV
jgi:2'-5' RNA ligase